VVVEDNGNVRLSPLLPGPHGNVSCINEGPGAVVHHGGPSPIKCLNYLPRWIGPARSMDLDRLDHFNAAISAVSLQVPQSRDARYDTIAKSRPRRAVRMRTPGMPLA
jgi:hypothetical protein